MTFLRKHIPTGLGQMGLFSIMRQTHLLHSGKWTYVCPSIVGWLFYSDGSYPKTDAKRIHQSENPRLELSELRQFDTSFIRSSNTDEWQWRCQIRYFVMAWIGKRLLPKMLSKSQWILQLSPNLFRILMWIEMRVYSLERCGVVLHSLRWVERKSIFKSKNNAHLYSEKESSKHWEIGTLKRKDPKQWFEVVTADSIHSC